MVLGQKHGTNYLPYTFIPFINAFLKSVAKLNYVLFLVLCLSIWNIVPSLLKTHGKEAIWFGSHFYILLRLF